MRRLARAGVNKVPPQVQPCLLLTLAQGHLQEGPAGQSECQLAEQLLVCRPQITEQHQAIQGDHIWEECARDDVDNGHIDNEPIIHIAGLSRISLACSCGLLGFM